MRGGRCILGPFLIALIALAAATSCQGPGSKTTPQTTEPASGFAFTAAGDYGSSKDTTATLDLKSTDLEYVLLYFPFYRILGKPDHGRPNDASEVRTVIVFAREASALAAGLKEWPLERSTVPERLSRTLNAQQFAPQLTHRYMDGRRTLLADKFFSTLDFDPTENLLAAVAGMEGNVEAVAKWHDLV